MIMPSLFSKCIAQFLKSNNSRNYMKRKVVLDNNGKGNSRRVMSEGGIAKIKIRSNDNRVVKV